MGSSPERAITRMDMIMLSMKVIIMPIHTEIDLPRLIQYRKTSTIVLVYFSVSSALISWRLLEILVFIITIHS
jgi:hypothetical protein